MCYYANHLIGIYLYCHAFQALRKCGPKEGVISLGDEIVVKYKEYWLLLHFAYPFLPSLTEK